jgi:hypothetical protein
MTLRSRRSNAILRGLVSHRLLRELVAAPGPPAGTISKPFSPKDLPDQLRAIWAPRFPDRSPVQVVQLDDCRLDGGLLLELAREIADHLIGVAEPGVAVLFHQLVDERLVARQLTRQ